MTRFGIICPAAIGHLNPMCALGRELQRRGHHVTLFGIPDIENKVIKSGLGFWKIGEVDFPLGKLEQNHRQLGEMSGLSGFKFTVNWLKQEAAMLFREIPPAIQFKSVDIDMLLVDQVSGAGGTIADYLNLPFVTICNALLVNREAGVPPYFTHWSYDKSWWAYLRNQTGNVFISHLVRENREFLKKQRRQWGLSPHSSAEDSYSKLAQICQLPPEFDFPRVNLSRCFHYTGPLQEPSGLEPVSFPSIYFPFDKLNEKPLIYASLGTLQNRKWEIFEKIAEACVGLDVQLVISLGNPNTENILELPGSPIVVPFAPHQQLIERASLIITHAGMNTTLGSLSSGVPMVAIPVTNEQPGIAARIARTGAGEVVPLSRLSAPVLRGVIQKVLTEKSFRENALRMQAAIQRSGGVTRAADIIEHVVSIGKPTLADVM